MTQRNSMKLGNLLSETALTMRMSGNYADNSRAIFNQNWEHYIGEAKDCDSAHCRMIVMKCVQETAIAQEVVYRWDEEAYEAAVLILGDRDRPRKTQVYAIVRELVDTIEEEKPSFRMSTPHTYQNTISKRYN